jgi:hypothetical protein
MHFHFLQEMKTYFQYLTCIFVKIESKLKNFITKMLSAKFSTNSESFKGFGRGSRIDLAISHGYTYM